MRTSQDVHQRFHFKLASCALLPRVKHDHSNANAGMVLTDLKGSWDVQASQRSGREQIWILRMAEPIVSTGYVFSEGPDSIDAGINFEGAANSLNLKHKARRLNADPELNRPNLEGHFFPKWMLMRLSTLVTCQTCRNRLPDTFNSMILYLRATSADFETDSSNEDKKAEEAEEEKFIDLPMHTFKKGDPIVFREAFRDGSIPENKVGHVQKTACL